MYIPTLNREDDPATLLTFMQAHSFATLITAPGGIPLATHLPVQVLQAQERVIIRGHVARANPHWQTLAEAPEALVLFQGPHAYISPTLYEKYTNVPTWNYVAVHAYGPARLLTEPAALYALLAALIDQYEAPYQAQWNDLPDHYRDGMIKGIVGFELAVTRLEGKYKLSQNRTASEQHAIVQSLSASADTTTAGVAALMQTKLAQ